MNELEHNVWYEKYRPRTVNDVVLPPPLKDKILNYLTDGGFNLPHLGLFSRTPGTGKSSLAKAILNETQAEALWINASLDKGIDVLRTRIQRFAANKPLRPCVKIVVMDEFDHFSKDGQAAFRGFIDQFGDNVRFIFTGNYRENIIDPLLDRLEIYDFNQFRIEDIAPAIFERLKFILTSENIEFEPRDVLAIIKQDYPRIRKMIGSLGQCIKDNKLEFNTINKLDKLDGLLQAIKTRDLQMVQKICYSLGETEHVFSYLAENIKKFCLAQNEINAIIILAKYQDMNARARDRQLNVLACCYELIKL